jgi:HD superfamily phosphohydrolase
VVSSQFDADRLDYMRRDRLMTGTQHAAVDFDWLLANLEIGTVPYGTDDDALGSVRTFVLGPKAIHAAEGFVLGLFQLYPTVYFHKATRGAEALYTELLTRVVELAREGAATNAGLSDNHPLVTFARAPDAIESALGLDDSVVWGALSPMADAPDRLVSEFARRLRDRKLYKCIDIRAKLEDALDDERIETACSRIRERLSDWTAASGGEVPRILIDEAARSPYKQLEESKGPLDQINIGMPDGALVDLGRRSPTVAAIRTFRLLRAYVAAEDGEARQVIHDVVEGEMRA